MAKEQKQTTLTMEERLEKALVTDWEQPYKVPENWVWTRAGIISELNPPKQQPEDLETKITFVPMAAVSEVSGSIETPEIRPAKSVVKGFTSFREGDVIFAKITPCMENGKAAIAENLENGFGYGSTEFFVFRPSNAINGKLLHYFLRNPAFRDEAKQNMSGAVGQQRVSKEFLSQHVFPLPPLAEQQRIVDRIEGLFAKLDEAKEKAQTALDSFETRRAAILHKAFTGELTVKWRKEHGVGMESWEMKSLTQLCESLKYGTAKKSKLEGSVVVIRMGNLQNGEIDWSNLAFSDDEKDIAKYSLTRGDVLFNRTNSPELVGKTSIYRGEYPAIYAGYLIKLDYGKNIVGDYLNYVMNSTAAKNYCNSVKSDGVNQSNINAKKIGAFIIPVPSLPEQQKIVRILNDLFAKEQQAKDAVTVTLDQINLIKKSILARAFRGELGTNDPAEESALELLKQCSVQQANKQEQVPKKKRAPAVVLSDEVR